jgi:hypothetical protein
VVFVTCEDDDTIEDVKLLEEKHVRFVFYFVSISLHYILKNKCLNEF